MSAWAAAPGLQTLLRGLRHNGCAPVCCMGQDEIAAAGEGIAECAHDPPGITSVVPSFPVRNALLCAIAPGFLNLVRGMPSRAFGQTLAWDYVKGGLTWHAQCDPRVLTHVMQPKEVGRRSRPTAEPHWQFRHGREQGQYPGKSKGWLPR